MDDLVREGASTLGLTKGGAEPDPLSVLICHARSVQSVAADDDVVGMVIAERAPGVPPRIRCHGSDRRVGHRQESSCDQELHRCSAGHRCFYLLRIVVFTVDVVALFVAGRGLPGHKVEGVWRWCHVVEIFVNMLGLIRSSQLLDIVGMCRLHGGSASPNFSINRRIARRVLRARVFITHPLRLQVAHLAYQSEEHLSIVVGQCRVSLYDRLKVETAGVGQRDAHAFERGTCDLPWGDSESSCQTFDRGSRQGYDISVSDPRDVRLAERLSGCGGPPNNVGIRPTVQLSDAIQEGRELVPCFLHGLSIIPGRRVGESGGHCKLNFAGH